MSGSLQSLHLMSEVDEQGMLHLSLEERAVPEPGPDEVIVEMTASPINPSDLGLLLGPADLTKASYGGTADRPTVSAPIPQALHNSPGVIGRMGQAMGVGNEGAGTVVRAGSSEAAQALLGKVVAIAGGDSYANYCRVHVMMAMPMADNVTAREAASSFVNPLTALGMVETLKDEGFKALIHTAAASNLGQMLNKVCQADGIELVNIVRKPEQEVILRDLGAKYVINSTTPSFVDDLTAAVSETGAYLAFDATGGGRLANDILLAMENVAAAGQQWSRYGSDTLKKVYVYGKLDMNPIELTGAYGLAFSVSGWLLTNFLGRVGLERMVGLQQRVSREIKTTFSSDYVAEISLRDALSEEAIAIYSQRTTGNKYLINPSLP